jgi:hypothetical protein
MSGNHLAPFQTLDVISKKADMEIAKMSKLGKPEREKKERKKLDA